MCELYLNKAGKIKYIKHKTKTNKKITNHKGKD